MKKLKLFVFGASIFGLAAFGISYFAAAEVEAQSSASASMCTWNGKDCFDPFTTNYCLCETVVDE